MAFPLGDIIRAIASPKSWLGRIFGRTKGVTIGNIALDEGHGIAKPGESKFDRIPHQPGPPSVGPRR